MGCSFPLEPSAEITSQNRCSEWDALSGRASGGKRIPEFGSRVGHTFRLELQPESASRNPRLEWDALSGTALIRKPRPRISLQSGTPFPAESSGGKFIPELALGVGHGFRMEPQRKLYPSLSVYSGMPFPLGASTGTRVPYKSTEKCRRWAPYNFGKVSNSIGKLSGKV